MCLSNPFLSHLLSFPLLLLKELSKLHYPVLELRLINEKITSIRSSDRLQALTLGFCKRMLLVLMEIYDYVEHTDAIVPKSWVKGQETLSQINSAAT